MNTTAVDSTTTTSYDCLFCGVSYHHVTELRGCSVCGQTVASGWLVEKLCDDSGHERRDRVHPALGEEQMYRAA